MDQTRAGIIAATTANFSYGSKKRDWRPTDFLPIEYRPDSTPHKRKLRDYMRMLVTRTGENG